MYSFVINKKPYAIPLSAEELTLGQFMALQNATDELSKLTALMGEVPSVNVQNEVEAAQFGRELDGSYKLIDLLQQDVAVTIESGLLLVAPKMVTIMGLQIAVKENFVNTLPYWGYVHTSQAIRNRAKLGKDEDFNATDLIPGILAHNMYSLVTKSPYNEAKAEEFVDVINEMKWVDAMRLGNFFFASTEKIMGVEQEALDYSPKSIEIEAGIDVFNKYSSLNTLETLSSGDVTRWEEIKGLPYDTVFVKLCMNKDKREYEEKYSDLIKSKNK